jgi:hypothetical protein
MSTVPTTSALPDPAVADHLGLRVIEVTGGWIVGLLNAGGGYDKLLPHGENIPYKSADLAHKALEIVASVH